MSMPFHISATRLCQPKLNEQRHIVRDPMVVAGTRSWKSNINASSPETLDSETAVNMTEVKAREWCIEKK